MQFPHDRLNAVELLGGDVWDLVHVERILRMMYHEYGLNTRNDRFIRTSVRMGERIY